MLCKPYHDRIYEARWLEGKDIGNEQTLSEIANRCGLDRYAFLEASYPTAPLVSYQINRQLSGRFLPPLVIRAVGAHCPVLAMN